MRSHRPNKRKKKKTRRSEIGLRWTASCRARFLGGRVLASLLFSPSPCLPFSSSRRFSMLDMKYGLATAGRLAVRFVLREIRTIGFEQFGMAFDDEHVLGVFHLGLVREIEAAGDQNPAVDDHDLVVGDGVLGVDVWSQAVVDQVAELSVGFLLVAAVENDLDVYSSPLGFDEGVGNGFGGKRISLDQYLSAGSADFPNSRVGAASLGRMENGHRRRRDEPGAEVTVTIPKRPRSHESGGEQQDFQGCQVNGFQGFRPPVGKKCVGFRRRENTQGRRKAQERLPIMRLRGLKHLPKALVAIGHPCRMQVRKSHRYTI